MSKFNVKAIFSLKSIIFLIIVSTISVSSVFADQVPGSVYAVEADPFYFSEGDFGIEILRYFDRSLEPYLVPGVTTEESSIKEISDAYNEATEHLSQKVIVSEENRGTIFVLHFSGGEIPNPISFTSFSKFSHLKFDRGHALVPTNQQYVSYGFELESLPSKDKETFYKFLVSKYINEFYSATPFDVTVDILTGDGHILQKWQYSKCELLQYYSFLDENLTSLKFVGKFVSEIREKSSFRCAGFSVDFELEEPVQPSETLLKLSNFIPSDDERATTIMVHFSGGEFKTTQSSSAFSKFVPVKLHGSLPILLPGYVMGDKPRFTLESLPSQIHEKYYELLSNYLNAGKDPEPFDVTVELVTGDNTVLQSWKYSKCDATNHALFYLENLVFYKFKQDFGSEIRDKTYFECSGLQFFADSDYSLSDETGVSSKIIPTDDQRAQTFVVHFQGTDISPAQTSYSFTKFAHITNEELPILLPNAPFDATPKFYLESLPSKDQKWFYEFASRFINSGKIPELFDVTIDVVTGSGDNLQTWEYSKCRIIDYNVRLENSLITVMFTEQFQSEIRDRAIFSCSGIFLNSQIEVSQEPKKTRPIDFIPTDEDRASVITVEISGGGFEKPFTIYTFDDFKFPKKKSTPSPYNFNKLEYGLELNSLPSVDKKEFYELLAKYYNVGKDPEPFDVSVNILTGDGTILQTRNYTKCKIADYETFLFDNLLFFKGHGGRGSEIRDNAVFDCVGFSVDFTMRDSLESIPPPIPPYEDRAVMYLLQVSGGELTHSSHFELIQKLNTIGNQQLLIESLPNKHQKQGYDFISRYLNPGKSPEPFFATIEVITGDGTILASIDYSDCNVANYAVNLKDTMVSISFLPQLKSEIREKGIFDCAGVSTMILPEKSLNSRWHIPPRTQTAIGIPANEVICKENFDLMLKQPVGTAACIKEDDVSKLEQRGWEKTSQNDHTFSKLKPILPTQEERATSFVAHFQGTDIAPPQTSYTFSKFSPITNTESKILKSDNPLDSSRKQFYLESLPSKDKQWLYELASMYINPGMTPQQFMATIEVISGDGTILQTWDYRNCKITNYDVYLDESLLIYKFKETWQSEIRDRTFFNCGGLKLNYS